MPEKIGFVGVGRIGRYDAPGLAGGAVSQRLHVVDFMLVRFGGHDITVCEVRIQPQRAPQPADGGVTGSP